MSDKMIRIGSWSYFKPKTTPNKDGNIVFTEMHCWGPLQVEEIGINADGIPYRYYRYVEDDFFNNEPEIKPMSWDELKEHISSMIISFEKEYNPEWAEAYKEALDYVEKRMNK